MKNFYLDLAKICFGVGFYGCVAKIESPTITIIIGSLSLLLVIIFAWIGYTQQEDYYGRGYIISWNNHIRHPSSFIYQSAPEKTFSLKPRLINTVPNGTTLSIVF